MHASIWTFTGDPDELTRRYDAMVAEFPADAFLAHLCLRTPDGIVIVDTCPSQEAFEAFAASDSFRDARRRHGLSDPTEVRDYPVHDAYAAGERLTVALA
jgi:heme-degrading monooxygenase HmoA